MRYKNQAFDVPEQTVAVARAAFPKGNPYMTMRDEIGRIYEDSHFAHLFSHAGRPGESPGNLALVLVMQHMEGLTDQQAADAVRSRIDWKYALGLKLTDSGFDRTVLVNFRKRLLEGEEELALLEHMLARFQEMGLLKGRGRQRTDSTHVLAATRELNRLETVGETMRHALEAIAQVAPEWLQQQAAPEWFDRYGPRIDQHRLPDSKEERQELAEAIGRDGVELLTALYVREARPELRSLPEVEGLRQIWVQQYVQQEGEIRWRQPDDLPPGERMIQSPHDLEARYSHKASGADWTGYKTHFTETCDPDSPRLVTHVMTTASTVPDKQVTSTIQEELATSNLSPAEHYVDGGYMGSGNLVKSEDASIDLIGPVQQDSSWQARDPEAFDITCFIIDWDAQQVTCPMGQKSVTWSPSHDVNDNDVIHVRFARATCSACTQRERCTRAKKTGRSLKLRTRAAHEARQRARRRQETSAFKQKYKRRAGVEGLISQGVRRFGLRRTPYIGLAKTHLHNILVAAATNLARVLAWLQGVYPAQTRMSAFQALAPAT